MEYPLWKLNLLWFLQLGMVYHYFCIYQVGSHVQNLGCTKLIYAYNHKFNKHVDNCVSTVMMARKWWLHDQLDDRRLWLVIKPLEADTCSCSCTISVLCCVPVPKSAHVRWIWRAEAPSDDILSETLEESEERRMKCSTNCTWNGRA